MTAPITTFYRVVRPSNAVPILFEGVATDAVGVTQIIRDYYRKFFGYPGIEVSVDLEALTVTASANRYRKTFAIVTIERSTCSTA